MKLWVQFVGYFSLTMLLDTLIGYLVGNGSNGPGFNLTLAFAATYLTHENRKEKSK